MKRSVVACVASLLGMITTQGFAFSSGPPDDFCGNPPSFNNCSLCHNSFPVNSGDGALGLDGLPTEFAPGATYDLSVILQDPDQERWGFELTVLDDVSMRAGTLVVTDPTNTQLSVGFDRDFIKHTSQGTRAGTPGPTTWSFQWTAPVDDEEVTFFVAGNAADNSGSPLGDYIYLIEVTLHREQTTPVALSTWSRIKSFYR